MVQKTPHKSKTPEDAREAGSVDREPSAEPTPSGQGLPVSQEDEPRGHPTSDRFQTEQAHRKGDKGK
jgi:hypothetical protein